MLSDATKRRTYDQYGEEGLKQQGGGGGGGGHHDIFSQCVRAAAARAACARHLLIPVHRFFGGGGFGGFGGFGGGDGEPETAKGHTVTVDLEVTLRDVYLGATRTVTREKGTFKTVKGGAKRKCNCKTKMNHRQIAPGMFQQYATQSCDECPAVKLVRTSETLTVEVEPGMAAGHEITFFEQGEPLLDGEPGDLKFVLKLVPPAEPGDIAAAFTRVGDNLQTVYSITLAEALVGFTRTFVHLDGRTVTLRQEGVTRPGEVVKVAGEGMPVLHSSRKGDLFVTYTVRFPSSLTAAQKASVTTLFSGASWQSEWSAADHP